MQLPRYVKLQMVLFGLVLAFCAFSYGVYALVTGTCTLVGRGAPIGTFVTFYGVEARILSLIYIGSGLWLFSGIYLSRLNLQRQSKLLSWIGASLLMIGLCFLLFVLSQPVVQAWAP